VRMTRDMGYRLAHALVEFTDLAYRKSILWL
jgi:hypothetical protein